MWPAWRVLPHLLRYMRDTREVQAQRRKKKVNIFSFYGYFFAECVHACKAYYVLMALSQCPLVPPTSVTVSG